MATILKCKMCGGDMQVVEGTGILECEYCGSKQTIPNTDTEKKTGLFNRANKLRIACDFDRAAGIYESIITDYPDEAEAYWGICLCKYGIEYVDDPSTGRKIPTCHRTSFESIFSDEYFQQALENADEDQVALYRAEAKEIDRIQQYILKIAKSEKPYDVFICYKETDRDGGRTKESVLGQDIYDMLISKGLKVFFSRITLEDKLGQEYEPYIFSALNSAKIMLALGTSYENYNAVWVKNEWSRFLGLMKQDKSKILIPCYSDIDAYDMPEEFKGLQGQDMSKLGAMQDLVRAVVKLCDDGSNNADKADEGVKVSIDSLYARAKSYVEDKDWGHAREYCNRILDIDIGHGETNLLLLLIDAKASGIEELEKNGFLPEKSKYYKKVKKYLANDTVEQLEKINDEIKRETAIKNKKKAKTIKIVAPIAIAIVALAILFPTVIKPALDYQKAVKARESGEYDLAHDMFVALGDYSNSEVMALDTIYQKALSLMDEAKYDDAISVFDAIKTYSDSKVKIKECENLKAENEYEEIVALYNHGSKDEAYKAMNSWIVDHKDYQEKYKEFVEQYCDELILSEDFEALSSLCQSIYDHSKKDKAFEKIDKTFLRNVCVNLVEKERYQEADSLNDFYSLEKIFDDEEYLCAMRYAYVVFKGSTNDKITSQYVDYLLDKKYKNIDEIRQSLYSWKVTIIPVEGDGSYGVDLIRYKWYRDRDVYLACYVSGGNGGKEKGTVKWTWGNGREESTSIDLRAGAQKSIKLGKNLPRGMFTVVVLDKAGNEVGSYRVNISD